MSEGFIVLYRKILNWEWWDDPNTFRLFLYLLLTANHEEGKWHGQIIKRGQLITGRYKLAKATKLSPRSVRTCLSHLKSTNEVAIESASKYSIITIVNYSKYQNKPPKTASISASISASNRPANGQQTA